MDKAAVQALLAKVSWGSVKDLLEQGMEADIRACVGHIDSHVRDLEDDAKALWETVKASL